MKKMIVAVLFGVLALTGCNEKGDNGELAGIYLDSSNDKLILNAKNGQYEVGYQYQWKGKYGDTKIIGFAEKNGDYLVSSEQKDKKMFEIKDGELVSVYTSSNRTFKKVTSN
ncbi:TPA: hypothetical protein ACQFL4_003297 [Proteus mirabilis]|nr:hypothetical protein [Proteus mirabilis]